MEAKRIILGIVVILFVVVGFFVVFDRNNDTPPDGPDAVNPRAYTSEDYGLSFEKLEGYNLLEAEDPINDRYSIVLSRIEDSDIPINGEGPTAITVDIFEDIAVASIDEWLRENTISNFNLRIGEPSEREVDGVKAMAYSWDGLYRGRSIAFMHNGNVILISGTYLEETDPIYSDFGRLVDSVELTKVD